MADKEVLAGLKIAYYNLADIVENSDEEIDIQELEKVQDILEAKYEEIYENSCPLRFIDNWKLDKCFIEQK